ncbi:MAG: hypothetical protein JNK82_05455 [Myxococcaceae bacterium]|nr:hypothetical protein [Myxococcaceae bacterium]
MDVPLPNLAAWALEQGAALPRFQPGDAAVTAPRLAAFLRARLRERPVPAFIAGAEVAVRVGDVVLTIDVAAREVREGPRAQPARFEYTLPASVAEAAMSGAYDPFEVLFSYRVDCRYRGPALPAEVESTALVVVFVALVDPAALHATDAQLDGLAGLMAGLG